MSSIKKEDIIDAEIIEETPLITKAEALKIAHEQSSGFGSNAPEDVAAKIFMQTMPEFTRRLPALNKKGVIRVLDSIIREPLEPAAYKLSKQERELVSMGQRLMDAKFIMISTVLKEQLDKVKV